MKENLYLQWLSGKTGTAWWHDSAKPEEIACGIANGAVGVTTNPLLIKQALYGKANPWMQLLASMPKSMVKEEKAEEIIRRITVKIAETLEPVHQRSLGQQGYVCAQVNPRFQGDSALMLKMARRLSKWAPNIAVKLPVTAAGLDTLEECLAEGMTVTATVSFSVAQVVAVAERCKAGLRRAAKNGLKPGKCFAVIMVGRVDDYLRDVAHDRRANVEDADISLAGTAMVKRAYGIFKEKKYEAVLMPSGMRSAHHVTALSGGDMVLSIHPKIQDLLLELPAPFEPQIEQPVDVKAIKRLKTIPEFSRAYEPDGMTPFEFISFGAVQRTLSQFVDAGWANIEEYSL